MPPSLPRATIRRGYSVIRHRRLSPPAFRRVTAVALWVMILIVVSGAAVRLTGSGLGCPDWPSCTATRVVAPLGFHPWVEFANRLVNAAIGIIAVVTLGAALIRVRRRRDLTWLSVGLIVGVLAEIVLGGITVLEKLAPQLVSAHFLLAMLFLADAYFLHQRAGLADEDIPHKPGHARPAGISTPTVPRPQLILARLLIPAAAAVIFLGTIVTSTGPHGGSPQARRYHLSLHTVAQLHGSSAEIFVGLTVLTIWAMVRAGVNRTVLRRAETLLAVTVAQGIVGYVQYATRLPAGLVEIHVAGAVALLIATLHLNVALTSRRPVPTPTADTETRQPVPLVAG